MNFTITLAYLDGYENSLNVYDVGGALPGSVLHENKTFVRDGDAADGSPRYVEVADKHEPFPNNDREFFLESNPHGTGVWVSRKGTTEQPRHFANTKEAKRWMQENRSKP